MNDIIKKIVLNLGKKQVELTPGQAKKLKEALDEMFGEKVVKEIHHHDYWRWRPYWWDISSDTISPKPDYTIWSSDSCNAQFSNETMTLSLTG